MITKLFYTLHRILGTLLSILFFAWFVSGIVMIYHGFPRVGQQQKMEKLEPLPTDMPDAEEILARMPDTCRITGMSVSKYMGETIFEVQTDKGVISLPADSTASPAPVNWQRVEQVARLWCSAPINRIDTLRHLDQWIPFGQLKRHFPIYKFHFANPDKTEVYVSSVSGEVLQCTSRTERLWAWMGAIPHWVYFTRLRQDVDLWKKSVIWLSGIGCIMTIAGLYVGIHAYRAARIRRGKWQSPYRKKWYWWHHVTGTVFGLFVLTWVFSGMMSLADVPEWIGPVHQSYPVRQVMNEGAPQVGQYPLDYRQVIARYENQVTRIEWDHFRSLPVYHLWLGGEKLTIDASCPSEVKKLELTREQVLEAVRAIHGEDVLAEATLMNEYDHYYITRRAGQLPLPVWKVSVNNADHTCYYIDPSTGSYRDYNTHRRWGFWMYNGLHSLRLKFLIDHPVLWTTVMWVLLIGGTVVSLTGFVLGLRYLKRLFRRRFN